MYRQLLTLLFALGLLCPAGYAAQVDAVVAAVQQAVNTQKPLKMQHSSNAHKLGVIPVKLTVQALLDKEDYDVRISEKECPVVRISSHYLMGSLACVGFSSRGTLRHSGGGSGDTFYSHPNVKERKISAVKINGQTIKDEDIIESPENKIFLVRFDPSKGSPEANEKIKEMIQNKPAVNIFAPKDPTNLENSFTSILLNRERLLCSSRTCSEMEIADVCTETGCFKLAWNAQIRGDSGDPVFGVNPENSTEEFLLGFNVTDVIAKRSAAERLAGRKYTFFDRAKLESFLREKVESVSPSDWQQMQKKIVSEDYFQK